MNEEDEGQKIFLYYIEVKSMWNIGTPIGYDPAWMHVKDTALIPTEITTIWRTRYRAGDDDDDGYEYKTDPGVKIEGAGPAPSPPPTPPSPVPPSPPPPPPPPPPSPGRNDTTLVVSGSSHRNDLMGTFVERNHGNDGKPCYKMKGEDEGKEIFIYYIEVKSMWNIGTPIGYDPAWMHVKDTALIPTEITATWLTRSRDSDCDDDDCGWYKTDSGVKIEGTGPAPAPTLPGPAPTPSE
jgi:hypothetical protein